MNTKPIAVYSASAGSGKTYTLSQKYLELILADTDEGISKSTGYRNILAVTFTKKAAGEMKKRILEDLANCAKPEPFDKKTICAQALGVDEEVIQIRAGRVLRNLLFDYSRFDLLTIDSFVDRVVRSFAREQKLSANYNLEIKTRNIHKYLIAETLNLIDESPNSELKKSLISILTEADGGKPKITNVLGQTAALLLNDEFQTLSQNGKYLEYIENSLSEWRAKAEPEMQGYYFRFKAFKDGLLQKVQEFGLEPQDFLQGQKSIPNRLFKKLDECTADFEKLKNPLGWKLKRENFDSFYKSTDNYDKWVGKTNKNPNLELAARELIPFCIALLTEIKTITVETNTINIIQKNYYQLAILKSMNPLLQKYRDENNLILLKDELDIALKIGNDFSPEILFEKLGRRYKHIFIDEFQDTGRKQWKFFQPLIENTAAENNFNLIVGDVKQSIYEWRGGDLQLLQEGIYHDLPGQIASFPLNINWRSAAKVIEFNNALFKALPYAIENEFKEKIDFESLSESQKLKVESGMKLLKDAFSSVEQEVPQKVAKAESGYVQWTCYENLKKSSDIDGAENSTDIALKLLLEKLKDVQDRGFKAGEIALLVRTGKQAESIAGFLSKVDNNKEGGGKYNLDLVSADSIKIAYSDSVRVIIAASKLLLKISGVGKIRPDFYNNESLKFLLTELLSEVKRIKDKEIKEVRSPSWEGVTGLNESFSQEFIETYIPAPLLETPSKIIRMGLPELMEEIIRLFDLHSLKGQEPYLNTFMAFVLDYSQTKGATLKGLIKEFTENEADLKIAIPDSSDAIKLLTIHTSKGLQYPVVIIPFADLDIVKSTDIQSTYIIDTEGTSVTDFPFYPVMASSAAFNSNFGEKITEKVTRLTLANLNLAYVACTRAETELHFIGPKPVITQKDEVNSKDKGKLVNLFLNLSLKDQAIHTVDNEIEQFSFGKPTIKHDHNVNSKKEGELSIGYPSSSWRPKLTIRPISKPKAEDSDTLDDKLSLGNFIHELMASVETEADLETQAAALLQNGNYNPDLLGKTLERIRKLMQEEGIKEWYHKPKKVFRELEIWMAKEGQNPEVKRPDRVVILENKTVVIDFKTGKESPSHHTQVKEYCSILKEMGYSNLEGRLVYIFGAGLVPVNIS